MSIFELNTANEVRDGRDPARLRPNSPVVEVFSALVNGRSISALDGKVVDKSIAYVKELASKAMAGDGMAVSELNTIQRFVIEPRLLEAVKIFDFMGTYRSIGYDVVPKMKTRKYESVDSRFQAASGDVVFGTHSFREYEIGTQTISSGYAVDYRELQTGNFEGTVAEGMNQVQIDMENKAVYYVVTKLYEALKNAKGVKHFAESSGVTATGVDNMLKQMRRYGPVNICGDYSVVSQFNEFSGYKTFGANAIPFGADVVAEEIRKTGLLSYYNGAHVVELPNSLNFTRPNADKSGYELYMPQGLLFFIPKGGISPLQIFRRGGMTTMTADDIVTRQRLTRFDLEIGAGVAEGMEDEIGLLSDTNFDAPGMAA